MKHLLLPLALSVPLGATAAAQNSYDLFTPVSTHEITRIHQNEVATRQQNVYMDFALLESQAEDGLDTVVNFNVFDDITIVGVLEEIELAYADSKIYHFSTGDGFWNYASIAVINDSAAGVIRYEGVTYTINTATPGQFTVAETDWSLSEPCGVDSSHLVYDSNADPGELGGAPASHNRHVGHMLITFTTDCVTAEGGLDGANALANLAVSEMNRCLANGDSEYRVNLVHTHVDSSYTQSGDQGTDLARYRSTSDGFLDSVHALRDAYGADYCELFIALYGTGIAYVNCSNSASFASSAFSVSKNTRAAWDYTLAHELGHNMGLQHNHSGSGAATTCSDRDYCFGHRTTNYRTVMAYNPGSVLPIYSNPNMVDPDGEALGTTTLEDSSRHIGEWYDTWIDYRSGVSIFHQVSTTFDGGNGSGGNMFDIKPKADLSLTGISIHTRIAAGTTASVNIWYREGTHRGFEGSSSGWTLLDSASGVSAGEGVATPLTISGTITDKVFEKDQTYGIYIEATNGVSGDFRYTNGYQTYENSYLRIESGSGNAYGGFGNSVYADRIWNGTLEYEGAWGEHYLATTMDGGINTFTGNMFDVEVHNDIVISSFDVNVSTVAGDNAGVDIWYKSGSYVGSEDAPMDWTFLGTDHKAVSAGPGAYTTITTSSPRLEAGNTYAFYIRSSNGDTIEYTSGSSTFFNTDMTVTSGVGLGGTNPFGTAVSGRTWNGQIRYRLADDTPHLVVKNATAGSVASLEVSNATPFGSVILAYSLRGGGPTSTPYGTAYLTQPWTQLTPFTADANGEGVRLVSVPPSAAGVQVWFHGLDLDSSTLTTPASLIVQ